MNPRANALMLFVLIILFGIGTGIAGYWLGSQRIIPHITFSSEGVSPTPMQLATTVTPSPTSVSPTPTASPTPDAQQITQIVDTFMKNFQRTATNDPQAAQAALATLTVNANQAVQQQGGSVAAGLSKFAGVPNPPISYTLGKPVITGKTATVASTWNFLSGPLQKVFHLTVVTSQWKIDTIQDK